MMAAPMMAPMIEPSPPDRLVPPMTTAAMTSSSLPSPAFVAAVARRPPLMIPARPQSAPVAA